MLFKNLQEADKLLEDQGLSPSPGLPMYQHNACQRYWLRGKCQLSP